MIVREQLIDIPALHQVIKGEFKNAEIIIIDVRPAAWDIDLRSRQ